MEENIFGSGVKLPSLPGLQSGLEDEILFLIREVDLEFQSKHKELLTELTRLRKLCVTQSAQIENLRTALVSDKDESRIKDLEEQLKSSAKYVEKLQNENFHLKQENNNLKKKIRNGNENEVHSSLMKSLKIEQEENKALREKLLTLNQHCEKLQSSAQTISKSSRLRESDALEQRQVNASNVLQTEIASIAEKFMKEEAEQCKNLELQMSEEISSLGKKYSEVS
ncbi:uncharacterized protein LOC129227653 [Uloborus diversus]|uniref:uncharacterized protein LOC129227653 n=1 Tax=Uloborus diversus TaxID=327109 RepID=UPI002409E818|nr:uncharacterized protein LOC129227653 [Uloborus diversus]